MNHFFGRVKTLYKNIPDKKPYIEFLTALLTVPVLLTVIILNINSLKAKKDTQLGVNTQASRKNDSSPQEKIIRVVETVVPSGSSSSEVCKKEIPPIGISYPEEGDKISDNPVQFAINYEKDNYCQVVWSYRINNGKWSDYDDKSISIYNLTPGEIVFELRVKGIATEGEKVLTRKFIYEGNSVITPTISPSNQQASSSAR